MKQQLLLFAFLFSFFAASAQFKVVDKDDKEIKTGYTKSFSQAGGEDTDPQNLTLYAKNTSDKPIFVKVICDDLSNTDGENFQMCFDLCVIAVEKGAEYPSEDKAVEVDAGAKTKASFWNFNEGDEVMKWTFTFQQYESARGKKTGKPVTFTYVYDKNGMSIEETALTGVSIYPTLVDNELNISSKESLTVSVYDFVGKRVINKSIASGDQKIDMSNLASQPYLVRFVNSNGQSLVKKIIVK